MDPNNNASNDWDPNATPHITLGRDKYAYIKYEDGKEYLDIREMIFLGSSLKRKRSGVLLTREEWRQFKQKFSNPEYLMAQQNTRLMFIGTKTVRFLNNHSLIRIGNLFFDKDKTAKYGRCSVILKKAELATLLQYAERIDRMWLTNIEIRLAMPSRNPQRLRLLAEPEI